MKQSEFTGKRNVSLNIIYIVSHQEFRSGDNPIMLATDVAARGLGMFAHHNNPFALQTLNTPIT